MILAREKGKSIDFCYSKEKTHIESARIGHLECLSCDLSKNQYEFVRQYQGVRDVSVIILLYLLEKKSAIFHRSRLQGSRYMCFFIFKVYAAM